MRKKQNCYRVRSSQYLSSKNNNLNNEIKKIMLKNLNNIEKMEFDEKIELFQQLEIAQGLRKEIRKIDELSLKSQEIIKKYETLPTKRAKAIYAERVKTEVFSSLKKSISKL